MIALYSGSFFCSHGKSKKSCKGRPGYEARNVIPLLSSLACGPAGEVVGSSSAGVRDDSTAALHCHWCSSKDTEVGFSEPSISCDLSLTHSSILHILCLSDSGFQWNPSIVDTLGTG